MDMNTLPKGHIIGWVPPPTRTSTSALSQSAKKNAKRKEKKEKERNGKIDEGGKKEEEVVPENWDDECGPQGSNSGTPDTKNLSMTATTDVEPSKENQQVSTADVERDLSSGFDKLNVK